jgi:phage-related protein
MVNTVTTDSGTNIVNHVKNSITSAASTGAVAGAAVAANSLSSPTGLVGNLVNNTTNAITGVVNGVVNTATGLVTGVIDTATNLVTGTVNAAVGLVNGVLALPGQIINSITATANGILSSIQTALASIGNMGGQIKSAIQAVETFSKTDLTSKVGTNMGDSRIPIPLTLTKSPTPQVSESGLTSNDSASDQQAKVLAKIKDLEEQIRQNIALINKEQRENAGLFTKISSSAKQSRLERDLKKANEEYQALVSNQNQAPPSQSPSTSTSEVTTTTEIDNYGNKIITTRGGGTSRFIPVAEAIARRDSTNR